MLEDVKTIERIKKIRQLEKVMDISIEFEQRILDEQQLCTWYKGTIAKIVSKPYILFFTVVGEVDLTCWSNATGRQLFYYHNRFQKSLSYVAGKYIHTDRELLEAIKSKASEMPEISVNLRKGNHIEITVLRLDNGKKRVYKSKHFNVLEAIEEGVNILDECIGIDRKYQYM